jgi:hypothetical protein
LQALLKIGGFAIVLESDAFVVNLVNINIVDAQQIDKIHNLIILDPIALHFFLQFGNFTLIFNIFLFFAAHLKPDLIHAILEFIGDKGLQNVGELTENVRNNGRYLPRRQVNQKILHGMYVILQRFDLQYEILF